MNESEDEEALSAACGALWHPQDAPIARKLCSHPQWTVRVSAVRTLARIGSPEDAPLLVRLLADEAWWVRYRAAEALCRLAAPATVDTVLAGLTDRFAADMLKQALADRAVA